MMHKYIPPQQLDMNVFRNADRHFECPISDCQASYVTGAELQLHINDQHVFLSNPSPRQRRNVHLTLQHSILQNANPSPNEQQTVLQNANPPFHSAQELQCIANANPPEISTSRGRPRGRPPKEKQTQEQHAMHRALDMHLPAAVDRNQHNTHPQVGHPEVAYAHTGTRQTGNPQPNLAAPPSMSPTLISPSRLTNQMQATLRPQLQCIWPKEAESYLRTLIMNHSLYGGPPGQVDRRKLTIIFKEFRTTIGLDFMGISANDDRIPIVFGNKVKEVQELILQEQDAERKRVREIEKNKRAFNPPLRFTTSRHPLNQPIVPLPIATPPLTPIISSTTKQIDVQDIWASGDEDTQIRIFCQLLRTAKSPGRMSLEWERWQAELRGTEPVLAVLKPTVAENLQATPASTPSGGIKADPTKADDLNSMIEKGLRESRMKREWEKAMEIQFSANQEENPAKRMKIATATMM